MIFYLSVIALVSAIITIYAKIRENNEVQYIFKPLTIAAIILMAVLNASSPPTFYQKTIVGGLIFSTVGDVFLINPKQFVKGLLSFLLAHICFAAAFFTAPNMPGALVYMIYITILLTVLWKNLGKLKIPVAVYAFVLAAMSCLALSRYLELNDWKSLLALLGSIFFVASDSLLAFKKFKFAFSFAEIFILSTYFTAQWLIALSI